MVESYSQTTTAKTEL